MTLAHRLRQSGRRVTLLEGADRLGGLASVWSIGEIVWDRHYHVILLSDSRLRGLLAELGLEGVVDWKETRTGIFSDGQTAGGSDGLACIVAVAGQPLGEPNETRGDDFRLDVADHPRGPQGLLCVSRTVRELPFRGFQADEGCDQVDPWGGVEDGRATSG